MPNISVQGDTNVHGGAPLDTGLSGNVSAGNKPVALADQSSSSQNDSQFDSRRRPQHRAGNQKATGGSGNVFVNNKPVHRVGDARIDGATAGPGISSVKVNGN
jgi:uncharacterized Zn-binding protein involved in type VI secretion